MDRQLNFPRAAKILVGIQADRPGNPDEAEDSNAGLDIREDFHKYLSGSGRKAIRFFKRFPEDPRIDKLFCEMEDVKKRWIAEHRTENREAYDLVLPTKTFSFAQQEDEELSGSTTLQ